MQFDDMTIKQLRKLTEEYKRLFAENPELFAQPSEVIKEKSAQEIIGEVE